MEEVGFVDIQFKKFQLPIGVWPSDKEEAEKAFWMKLAVEADLEGWINYMWNSVLGWTPEEAKAFASHLKRDLNNPKIHAYYKGRVAYGRKPE